ncbi:helix-turn-helix protein [Cytobacillus oceanisediminis]|uniref:Helix-turn-helix protein n=2 Tax=Cytobacillus oceanisediminis TaxID=665099 RepID=A0A2V2ZRF6_9BACI|nr:helix-turn-helix protein [Cytobacillus oceanisediminis]
MERFKKNMTQQEVSKATGISYSMLSKYERNVAKPKEDNLKMLAEFYGITVEELTEDNR